MLPVAPSNFPSTRRSVRLGVPANTAVASAALTSVGVRGTSLRTATAHDLARSVVTSPHVAVVSRRLMVVLLGNRALSNAVPSQRASETLAADGRGAKRPARLPVGCSGSRVRLPLPASSRFGNANSRSVAFAAPRARSGSRRGWRRSRYQAPRPRPSNEA